MFSIVLGAEYLSYVKSIETHAGTFLTRNILSKGTELTLNAARYLQGKRL